MGLAGAAAGGRKSRYPDQVIPQVRHLFKRDALAVDVAAGVAEPGPARQLGGQRLGAVDFDGEEESGVRTVAVAAVEAL